MTMQNLTSRLVVILSLFLVIFLLSCAIPDLTQPEETQPKEYSSVEKLPAEEISEPFKEDSEAYKERPSFPFISPEEGRSGWEILTAKERAQLPECEEVLFTQLPVVLTSINEIEPRGSLNPPEHTLASVSTDTYISVKGTPDLVAPADLWIITITPRFGISQDPADHVIRYALCKDVYGNLDHIKEFSPDIKKILESAPCVNPHEKPGQCTVLLLEPVSAGTPLGKVGAKQGNFNFGTWDLRFTNHYISPYRQGHLSLHSTCPYDYFTPVLRQQLLEKINRQDSGRCGVIAHDVAGTLQGDWFIGSATPIKPTDWDKLLFFGPDNRFPDQAVISTSGIFVDKPTKWIFSAQSSGRVNRRFTEVEPGEVYCYENDDGYKEFEKGISSGRIII